MYNKGNLAFYGCGLNLVFYYAHTVAREAKESTLAKKRFHCRTFRLLLLSWPLGGNRCAGVLSREIIRYILATGLYYDLACDKLDGRTTEPCHEQIMG